MQTGTGLGRLLVRSVQDHHTAWLVAQPGALTNIGVSPAYNQLVCCQCRPELDSEDYWFGLYKIMGPDWVATTWYDRDTSAYRLLVDSFPQYRDPADECMVYTAEGWTDRPCDDEHYFTCKIRTRSLLS